VRVPITKRQLQQLSTENLERGHKDTYFNLRGLMLIRDHYNPAILRALVTHQLEGIPNRADVPRIWVKQIL